jgi:hypothetical protein
MPRMIALAAAATLLASCAENSLVTSDPCGPWRAIYVAKADDLTVETARALLAHNRTGASLCGWGAAR